MAGSEEPRDSFSLELPLAQSIDMISELVGH